jgi:hypothetical protein
LHDEFIYSMSFDDYKAFPDPFPRTPFSVREVQARIERYPNPAKPRELFQWDIHGRLLLPAKVSMQGIAVVMIHGGAVNEFEFIFTPDGPEEYLNLTQIDRTKARVGVAQHIASLGIPVLAVSLPGHYSRNPWPPISERRPEFIIGEIPGDQELKHRLAVYTFRMCVEAIKVLIEQSLPDHKLFCWGHSTGGEYFYLLEQYGLKNQLVGGLGFGTGMPAWIRKNGIWPAPRNLRKREQRLFANSPTSAAGHPKDMSKAVTSDQTSPGAAPSVGSNWRIIAGPSSNLTCRISSTALTTSCCRRFVKFPDCRRKNYL